MRKFFWIWWQYCKIDNLRHHYCEYSEKYDVIHCPLVDLRICINEDIKPIHRVERKLVKKEWCLTFTFRGYKNVNKVTLLCGNRLIQTFEYENIPMNPELENTITLHI